MLLVQGYNISMGRGVYLNFDCCFLDSCPIIIGDHVMFGPHVQVITSADIGKFLVSLSCMFPCSF